MNVDIEEIEVKSVYTKTAIPATEYVANPYVGCPHGCQYCYASFMKRFTKHKQPWGSFVDIKHWKSENLPPKDCHTLMISSVTDPYNPLEEKYKRTQTILKDLLDHHREEISLLIITKSNLVCRDIPLLKKFKTPPKVAFSINTLDEQFKDEMDHAVSIQKRLEAMKTLYDHGIKTICFISPIFPEITDTIAIIKKVKSFVNYIWLENLQLRGDYKQRILNYIEINYPKFIPIYEQLYKGNLKNAKAYRKEYWTNYWLKIQNYCIENHINIDNSGDTSHTYDDDTNLNSIIVYNLLHDGSPDITKSTNVRIATTNKNNDTVKIKKEKEEVKVKEERIENKDNKKRNKEYDEIKNESTTKRCGGKITRSKSNNLKKNPY